jgi:[ribosomal protein S5]-alanine N-acetyltransferase
MSGLLIPADSLGALALHALIRRNDCQLAQYFPAALRAGQDISATRDYLADHQSRARTGRSYFWGIVAAKDELAGLVFLNHIDPDVGSAEAAGVLDSRYEGRGLMQRAMIEVFAWAKDQLGLVRVRFLIAPENTRSIAMANALGFRPETRPPRRFARGTPRETFLAYFSLWLD